MSYMDPKEEVIDIELTSHGKYLISTGKFKPTYYAFFDDDIIYDGTYAGFSEEQSDIEPRIQEKTPRMKAQGVYSGRSTVVFESLPMNIVHELIPGTDEEDIEKLSKGFIKIQEEVEKTQALQNSIGTTDSRFSNAPAWNVQFLKNTMSSSTDEYIVEDSKNVKIPQINTNISFNIYRNSPSFVLSGKEYGGKTSGFGSLESEYVSQIDFEDRSQVSIKDDDYIMIQIEESNTFFEKENFQIEFFEVLENREGKEYLRPMRYSAQEDDSIYKSSDIINGFITVLSDKEIDESLACSLISKDTTKNIFIDSIFKCGDLDQKVESDNIYLDDENTADIC